jgi:predicted AAA+ superfamily ATPase
MLLPRPQFLSAVEASLRRNPITALLGPRQCGKTTLAQAVAEKSKAATHFFDLEDDAVLQSLLGQPKSVLAGLKGLVVIDEVQRRPDLFRVLRVLADRRPLPARFLILGSASPDLLQQASESLAGRVEFVELGGFDLRETGGDAMQRLWDRGGFPRSFLAESDVDSWAWRDNFIRTFLERDIPQLGVRIPALVLRRFWTMVAHYHGQIWNSSEVAASLGVDDTTARHHLDLLAGAYMIRLLPPWFENLGKRQRRSPKAYLRDSGLLHALLGLRGHPAIVTHPKCGASWEGFAMEHVLRVVPTRDAYYWAIHSGPELDLLLLHGGRRLGFEFKFADAPTFTRSMHTARADLKLDRLWIVYPGELRYKLDDHTEVLPLRDCTNVLAREVPT